MKRSRIIFTAIWALIVLTFFACEQDINEVDPTTDQTSVENTNSVFANSNGRDRVRGSGLGGPMGFLYGRFLGGANGRSTGSVAKSMRAYMSNSSSFNARTATDTTNTDCWKESYTETETTYEYTLDFGTGCYYEGEFLKGKLVEKGTYTNGSFQDEITYTGFGGTDWEINGTEKYQGTWSEATGTNEEDEIWNADYTFQSDLKEKFTEEGVTEEITYTATGQEKWDESGFTVLASDESVTTNTGESYTSKVESPLVMDFKCEEDEVFVFVSGIESGTYSYTEDGSTMSGTYSIDFGSGACDNLITVTENGVSEEIDVAKEWDREEAEGDDFDEEFDDEEAFEEVVYYEITTALNLNNDQDAFESGKLTFDVDSAEIFTIEFVVVDGENLAQIAVSGEDLFEVEYEINEIPTLGTDCNYFTSGSITFFEAGVDLTIDFADECVNKAYIYEEEVDDEEEGEETD